MQALVSPSATGRDLDLGDLAAHENFHAWNVKQIRPFVLGPFDYTKPDRTANLWWMEGVTDYYAKVLTYRSGIVDARLVAEPNPRAVPRGSKQ